MKTKTHNIPHPEFVIQGLHSPKNATPSFWSLLSKVELSSFRQKKEMKKTFLIPIRKGANET